MGTLLGRSPYVESTKVVNDIGNGIAIEVAGNWPNPGWELEVIEKEIREGVLHLWLVGKNKPGMVIQVLHPFKYTITIDNELLERIYRRKVVVYSRESNTHEIAI